MKLQKKFELTTNYWSMISSLLHLVSLRPRVYYNILTNFIVCVGGGCEGQEPLAHPLNTTMKGAE